MKLKKISLMIICILMICSFVNAGSEKANDLLLGKTVSDVIYEISEEIVNNESEMIEINVENSLHPFKVRFISDDYATANNITCDGGNCTLFGQYKYPEQIIYILPESISQYYNFSDINSTLDKISNTFVHELAHHYQYTFSSFSSDMVEALGMDVTYISSNRYTLHNYNDYWYFNVSDIPSPINESIYFPSALTSYSSNQYVAEIQVRLVAVCFQEKEDYYYYWDMIETKDYDICQQYEFPTYVDNHLASDFEDFIESYIVNYLGIEIYVIDPEVSETIDSSFSVVNTLISSVSDVIIWIIPIFIIGGLISFIGFILFTFRDSLDKILDSILKKK